MRATTATARRILRELADRPGDESARYHLAVLALDAAGGDPVAAARVAAEAASLYPPAEARCLRCGHRWTPDSPGRPRACARCRDRHWDRAPGTVPRGRPRKRPLA